MTNDDYTDEEWANLLERLEKELIQDEIDYLYSTNNVIHEEKQPVTLAELFPKIFTETK